MREAGHLDPILVLRRFLRSVECGPFGDCWIWMASRNHKGYGLFRIGKRGIAAHRASYLLHVGPIPVNLLVLHRCDTPECVNPQHLFLGDAKTNTADMIAKGRKRVGRGERHALAKLNQAKAREIRALAQSGASQRKLAVHYGVSRGTIVTLLEGRTWAETA